MNRNRAHANFGNPIGFTLIEVLIAVTAFAIVLAALNAVYYGALRLRNKTVESLDQTLPLQQTISVIKRDLANLAVPDGPLAGELQSGLTSGNTENQVSPEFYTTGGRLEETAPWGEIQKVSYHLIQATHTSHELALIRSVTRNLLSPTEDLPVQQYLLGGVQEVLFSYYDGTQWLDSWDSTSEENKLPEAIKVQINLISRQTTEPRLWAETTPVELVVPITAQGLTNETSQTNGGAP